MIKITSSYYYFDGIQPGVGVIYLEGTYPGVQKHKREYLLPLVVEQLLGAEQPLIAWTLLEKEAAYRGDVEDSP